MVGPLLCTAVGMFLGLKLIPDRYQKFNSRLQYVLIAILIFCMGAGLGNNPDFFRNLRSVGAQAAVYALIPMACSVACVYVLTKKFLKGKQEDDSAGHR